jgi:hypothetical protein
VDSCDGDTVAVDDADNDETMATQGPEASGENQILVPSIGLLDPEGYVNMRTPWVERAKGEKVCLGGISLGKLTNFV